MGVVMRRGAHGGEHLARQRRQRHRLRGRPARARGLTRQAAVAGEGELAAGPALRSLEHHPADAGGIGRVRDSVEHHLRHRALAIVALARRLIIDRHRQALQRPRAVHRRTRRLERARRKPGIVALRETDRVALHRLGRAQIVEIVALPGDIPGNTVEIVEGRAGKIGVRALERHRGQRRALAADTEGASREIVQTQRRGQRRHRHRDRQRANRGEAPAQQRAVRRAPPAAGGAPGDALGTAPRGLVGIAQGVRPRTRGGQTSRLAGIAPRYRACVCHAVPFQSGILEPGECARASSSAKLSLALICLSRARSRCGHPEIGHARLDPSLARHRLQARKAWPRGRRASWVPVRAGLRGNGVRYFGCPRNCDR